MTSLTGLLLSHYEWVDSPQGFSRACLNNACNMTAHGIRRSPEPLIRCPGPFSTNKNMGQPGEDEVKRGARGLNSYSRNSGHGTTGTCLGGRLGNQYQKTGQV